MHYRGSSFSSGIVRAFIVVFGVLAFAIVVIGVQARPAAAATCGTLQAKVDAAPSGSIVDLPDGCVYRQQVTITKPLTLQGGTGVEIRGSDVWTGWTYSGGYWRSTKTLPSFPQSSVLDCEPNTSRCKRPEQVFLGGKALWQVTSNPTSGQFAVDSGRHVVLKDDPRSRFVEVSVRRHWILGTPEADNVTIQGFTMKHAANEARSGALMNRKSRLDPDLGGSNWTVQNNRLSDAHGAVISLKFTTGHKILNNDIARGGQIGINGAGNGEIIRGNKIHHNNTEDFNINGDGITEAGGAKFAPDVKNATFSYNEVYNNNGNGVHFDIDCYNNTISNNRIHHNSRKGIQYELSFGGEILGNVLWENGWATPERMQGAGITIHNSSTTEVYNNTLAWHPDGIAVFAVDREGTKWDLVHDVYVHDNTVLGKTDANEAKNHVALAWVAWALVSLFDPVNNNRGANNRYWYPSPESTLPRFVWNRTDYSKLSAFNLTRGEENGRYLTQSEKDALLASKGIPANPLPR